MGRLAGFSYREVARRLRTFGFQFDRPGAGSHEVWRHSQPEEKSRFRTIPETWRRARFARFCAKLD
jgi:predicted RNA binding protein YcfA (HicA-like mRNA interferase family)